MKSQINTSATPVVPVTIGRTVNRLMAAMRALACLALATLACFAADTQPVYSNLDATEFEKLTKDKNVQIVDVRTAQEFTGGHLSGAMNMDIHSPDFEKKVAGLDKSKICLVYCASGIRSVTACKRMGKLGFAKLYNLAGGIQAWTGAGKTVIK